MSSKPFDSGELRRLAEELLDEIAAKEEISEADRHDLATSLVRQWLTYDGNAALFVGGQQIYFVLAKTEAGDYRVIPEGSPLGWMNRLTQDWKINPDELPSLIRQLDLGQSVETINSEGLPIRLWTNPAEKRRGVEPLVKQPIPPGLTTDFRKIAVAQMEAIFGAEMDPRAMDELAASVAMQWQQYAGHACLFFRDNRQISLTLTEQPGGGCEVVEARERSGLEPLLCSLGIPSEIIPRAMARINLGQEVEFQDRQGVRSVLRYDPRARRVSVRVPPIRRRLKPGEILPICCPKCGAVLTPRVGDEPPRPCPICGHVVSLG